MLIVLSVGSSSNIIVELDVVPSVGDIVIDVPNGKQYLIKSRSLFVKDGNNPYVPTAFCYADPLSGISIVAYDEMLEACAKFHP